MTTTETVAPPEPLRRNHDFLRFWSGEALSLFGSQVTSLALPLTAVLTFNASSEQVGVLRFLQMVPYLFLALLFGAWADRTRRRPLMIAANAVRMVAIASIPVLSWLGLLDITGLLVIACVVGIFSVLFDVSWMAYVPTLVKDPRNFVEANQKLAVTQSTTDVAGPGVAGVLVGWLGPATALVLDAVTYLGSLVTLLLIRTREPEPTPPAGKRHLGREVAEGVRYVFAHRILRPLALLAPFTNFSLTAVSTLFLLYAVREKGLSAEAVGLILSVAAVGALVGAALSRTVIRRYPVGPIYVLALGGIYASPLLIPFADGPTPVVTGLFMLSFVLAYLGGGLSNVIQITLRQTCTPGPLLGRMTAAFRTLLFGGGALGGLFAGLIGGALGPRGGLIVLAIASAVMLVPVALSPVARLRTMPEQVPDPSTKD